MEVSAFDFALPEENIALRPVVPRDAARLLCVQPGAVPELSHAHIQDLPSLLRAGDLLVMNDTRVIPSRLYGVRVRGEARARVEIMLHLRQGLDRWAAFARPAKKLEIGETILFGAESDNACSLSGFTAEVLTKGEGGEVELRFALSGPALDEAIASHGELPLPPYIAGKRATDSQDKADYQTIYAREEGAVAAPTAGLHFTDELFAELESRGISRCFVTLHVGAGTFLPVKVEDTRHHHMHAEWGSVSADVAAKVAATRAQGGRIVAVGTTSLRLLESAADESGVVQPWSGETAIFITPGYSFRAVDVLMTNFHLPRSTLFMLVSAFCGLELMQNAYATAIKEGYRFYSYGDACLLNRAGKEAIS